MNTYKVLIAEDEGLIAMDIAARLEALGHTVVGTVSTAAEAIEQAPNAQVVLMDIRLDGPVDGIEAASKIRERYRLPVVFLTAQADTFDARTREAGRALRLHPETAGARGAAAEH